MVGDVEDQHFNIVFLGAACVSNVLCAGALWHLLHMPASIRTRLFWSQMMVLVLGDIFAHLLGVFGYVSRLAFPGVFSSVHAESFCAVLIGFFSIGYMVEVLMSVGLLAACRGSVRMTRLVYYATPVVVFFGGISMAVLWFTLETSKLKNVLFGGFILIDVATVLVSYGWCLALACSAPPGVRSRPLLQAFNYMLNSLITRLPMAVAFLAMPPASSRDIFSPTVWEWQVVAFIACMNGAINIATYMFWIWRLGRAEGRMRADSGGAGGRNELEAVLLLTYFDLKVDEDEMLLSTRRFVSAAVIDARQFSCAA